MNADSKSALAAIFAMVRSAMAFLVSFFNAADQSIVMIDVAVNDARERQVIRSATEMRMFRANYVQDAAKRLAKSRRAIDEFVSQSDDHKKRYNEAYSELDSAVKERLKVIKRTPKVEDPHADE